MRSRRRLPGRALAGAPLMLASQLMAAGLYQEGHPPARLDAGRGPGQRKGNAMRPGPLEPDRLTARLVARYPTRAGACCATEWCCSTTATSYFQTAGSSPGRRASPCCRSKKTAESTAKGQKQVSITDRAHHNRRPPTSRMHRAPGSGRVRAAHPGGQGAEHKADIACRRLPELSRSLAGHSLASRSGSLPRPPDAAARCGPPALQGKGEPMGRSVNWGCMSHVVPGSSWSLARTRALCRPGPGWPGGSRLSRSIRIRARAWPATAGRRRARARRRARR